MLNSMFYHFDKIVDRITIIIVHIYQSKISKSSRNNNYIEQTS